MLRFIQKCLRNLSAQPARVDRRTARLGLETLEDRAVPAYLTPISVTGSPDSAICRLEVTFPNGTTGSGTGVMVDSFHALTAGHCVYDAAYGGWATSIKVIPDEQGKLEHRRGESEVRRHEVKIEPDSALGRAIGSKEISANTYHKQAVNQLGRGLRIVAKAPDGVVEAMEDPAYPMMVAVQWHPERLTSEQEHLAPFRLLVEKATAAAAAPAAAL